MKGCICSATVTGALLGGFAMLFVLCSLAAALAADPALLAIDTLLFCAPGVIAGGGLGALSAAAISLDRRNGGYRCRS
ncbi:hypothetical protein [Nocardia sp. NPDC057227]|uniref:hypothetical protein n=1 Tax=Nocardia sp. NPDC057227 TaxID=3346056 RepID=UPI00363EA17E